MRTYPTIGNPEETAGQKSSGAPRLRWEVSFLLQVKYPPTLASISDGRMGPVLSNPLATLSRSKLS